MPSLTVYQIPQVIQTTRAGATGVNSATNRIDFFLSKNVTNEIEFLLKDIDRKPISLVNKTLILYVVDAHTQTLKLQKTLQSINELRGHYRLTVAPSDIVDWELGHYSYSLVMQREDQTQVLMYTDQNRTTYGFLEVKAGPLPTPFDPIVLTDELFGHATVGVTNQPVTGVKYRVSGGYPGVAQRDNRVGMHTCAIYSTGFKGAFKVQASLDSSVPTDDYGWFDVDDTKLMLDEKTGITSLQFVGSFMWVRFIYVPDSTNTGTIDKVLFKN
jgi:hypothetical protein